MFREGWVGFSPHACLLVVLFSPFFLAHMAGEGAGMRQKATIADGCTEARVCLLTDEALIGQGRPVNPSSSRFLSPAQSCTKKE